MDAVDFVNDVWKRSREHRACKDEIEKAIYVFNTYIYGTELEKKFGGINARLVLGDLNKALDAYY